MTFVHLNCCGEKGRNSSFSLRRNWHKIRGSLYHQRKHSSWNALEYRQNHSFAHLSHWCCGREIVDQSKRLALQTAIWHTYTQIHRYSHTSLYISFSQCQRLIGWRDKIYLMVSFRGCCQPNYERSKKDTKWTNGYKEVTMCVCVCVKWQFQSFILVVVVNNT